MIIFTFWIIFALLVGLVGRDRKIGFGMAFFWALLLSPLIGLIIALISDKEKIQSEQNKWKQPLETAKKAEYKQQTDIAIDNYMDALFYLEKDNKNHSKEAEKHRQDLILWVQNKVQNLKQLNPST